MIVDRYLIREITVPFVAVTAGLAFIFASYSATRYFNDAAQGQFPFATVIELIGLRVLVALELLIPIGLYLGLILGLGRLYGDQEMAALQAGGLSRVQMLRPLLGVALLVAVLSAALSLVGRPWAYGKIYALEVSAAAHIDLARIDPGTFHSVGDNSLVIYAQKAKPKRHRLDDVFVGAEDGNHRIVIRAEQMTRSAGASAGPVFTFRRGQLYRLDRTGQSDQTLRFDTLDWRPGPPDTMVGYKRKAASTATLAASTDRKDIAERQWRYSRPAATLFLALLGIAFARSSPRRGRGANAFVAAVVMALYYNLASIARNWVEHGSVPPFPGLYWVDAGVGLFAIAFLFRPGMKHY